MGAVIPGTLASTLADTTVAAIDFGGTGALIDVFEGTLPGDFDPGADPFLLELTLPFPSAAAAVDGVADFDVSTPPESTVLADGTPGYFIIYDGPGGNVVMGGTVGLYTDPDADLTVDSLTWVTGETVSLDVGTLTMPTS